MASKPAKRTHWKNRSRRTQAAQPPRGIFGLGVAAAATLALIYLLFIVLPAYAPWVAISLIALWALRSWSLSVCLLGPCLLPFMSVAASGEEGGGATLTRFFALFSLVGFMLNWQQARWALAAVPRRFWTALTCLGFGYLLATAADLTLHPEHTPQSLTSVGSLGVRLWFLVAGVAACLVIRDLRLILLGWVFFGVMMLGASALLYITTGSVLATRGQVAMGVEGWGNVSALIAGVGFLSVAGGAACFAWGRGTNPIWLIVGAAMVGATIFSGRRQALLAAVLTILLCFVIARNWRALIIGGVCFVVAFILIRTGPLREFLDKRESIQMELRGEGTGRLELFKLGLTYVKTSSLPGLALGLGLGGHARFAIEHGVTMTSRQSGQVYDVGMVAHNDFIGALVEGGLLALIGAVLLASEFFWALRVANLSHLATARREFILVFFIAAAGVLISAMATSSFIMHSGYGLLGGAVLGASFRLSPSREAATAPLRRPA